MAIDVKYWPSVWISIDAKTKLDLYVDCADGEISGFGDVEVMTNGDLLISDVYIFEQESSGASTEIDADIIASFITKCVEEQRDLSKIRLWWHSHADMGTFWSKTDEDTSNTCFVYSPFFVSLVANKKKEYRVRIDTFIEGGAHLPFTLDDIPLRLYLPAADGLKDQIKAEVEEKVSKATHHVVTSWPGMERHYCEEPKCTTLIGKDDEFCWTHRPAGSGEGNCRECGKRFILSFDEDKTGLCGSCRWRKEKIKKEGKESGSESAKGEIDEIDYRDALIEKIIIEYGPTIAEADNIEWDGENVIETANGAVLQRYKLNENPELYEIVMAELEDNLDDDEKDKTLAELTQGNFSEGFSEAAWDDDAWRIVSD